MNRLQFEGRLHKMIGFRDIQRANLPKNWAELLLDLGRRVQGHVRGGADIEEASKHCHVTTEYCELALAFVLASDTLKFRAMVEDWSVERIVSELGGLPRVWPHQREASAPSR